LYSTKEASPKNDKPKPLGLSDSTVVSELVDFPAGLIESNLPADGEIPAIQQPLHSEHIPYNTTPATIRHLHSHRNLTFSG
jgi:hypothetical protein